MFQTSVEFVMDLDRMVSMWDKYLIDYLISWSSDNYDNSSIFKVIFPVVSPNIHQGFAAAVCFLSL